MYILYTCTLLYCNVVHVHVHVYTSMPIVVYMYILYTCTLLYCNVVHIHLNQAYILHLKILIRTVNCDMTYEYTYMYLCICICY